jgi:hypothetical protein
VSWAELGREFRTYDDHYRSDDALAVIYHVVGERCMAESMGRTHHQIGYQEVGNLTIQRGGHPVVFKLVEVVGYSRDGISDLLELTQRAGAAIGVRALESAGVPVDVTPVLRWLGFVLQRAEGMRPAVVRTSGSTLEYAPRDRFILTRPFLASARVIEGMTPNDGEGPVRGRKIVTQERIVAAIMIVRNNPEWSDRRIATEAGISPSTLSRSDLYGKASLLARQQGYVPKSGLKRDDGSVDGADE